jgi:hypothetical protein
MYSIHLNCSKNPAIICIASKRPETSRDLDTCLKCKKLKGTVPYLETALNKLLSGHNTVPAQSKFNSLKKCNNKHNNNNTLQYSVQYAIPVKNHRHNFVETKDMGESHVDVHEVSAEFSSCCCLLGPTDNRKIVVFLFSIHYQPNKF